MEERIESGLAFKTNAWPLDPRKPTMVFIHPWLSGTFRPATGLMFGNGSLKSRPGSW